ncbi:caspase, EACC1-associated type [Nocardia brasiliensis]|uniref:caspase, EACC1-associated type n=1 Tax=Nocardia brasiliensis TaxID=37326 RepID=UPI0024547CE9|nr:caspase family protein [Nocardia brasiliensis]
METGLLDPPDPARSRAVIIGAARYDVLDDLPSVANNIERLDQLMRGADGWNLPPERCVKLLDSTREAVFKTVSAAAAAAEDALLVYYAGHGLLAPDSSDALHLALRGSHSQELYFAVEYSPLRNLIMNSRAKHRVVILDCCFSGSAAGRYLNDANGIADHAAIDGAYLMTATARTRLALAPAGSTYTAFTGELVKVLEEGIPDGPRLLDLDTVFRQVWRELRAKGRPEPEQRSRNAGHRLIFSRNRWTPTPTQEALDYAAALRDAFAAQSRSVTADSVTVERYLRGDWIAPAGFIEEICTQHTDAERLHALRRDAQRVARDTESQLAFAREEGERLRAEVTRLREEISGYHSEKLNSQAAAEQARRTSEEQFAEFTSQLDALAQQLTTQQQRAERLAEKYHQLLGTEGAKQRQLEHASAYVAAVEEELADLRRMRVHDQDEIRRLGREIDALRRQLSEHARRPVPTRSEVKVLTTTAPAESAPAADRGVQKEGRHRADTTADEGAASAGADPDIPAARARLSGLAAGAAFLGGMMVVLYVGFAWWISISEENLRFASGRKPVTVADTGNKYLANPPVTQNWDVSAPLVSTFEPPNGGLGHINGITGVLVVTMPESCITNTVRWQLEVNGQQVKSGAAHGSSEYRTDTNVPMKHRPDTVTLRADWDGGNASCPSFGLQWMNPELDISFDLLFPF